MTLSFVTLIGQNLSLALISRFQEKANRKEGLYYAWVQDISGTCRTYYTLVQILLQMGP